MCVIDDQLSAKNVKCKNESVTAQPKISGYLVSSSLKNFNLGIDVFGYDYSLHSRFDNW